MRDAFDDDGCRFDVELSARIVVEEEKRLRALHDDVVHAHRDKVLADAAQQAGFDGDLELGADAVGRGDENRILEPRGFQIEQPAEAAQIGVRTGPARRFRCGRDARNEFLAGVDIDTGSLVGEGVSAGLVGRCHVATEDAPASV